MEVDHRAHEVRRGVPDEHAVRRRQGLKPSRRVERVAPDPTRDRGPHVSDGLTALDTDADLEVEAEVPPQQRHGVAHLERSTNCPKRVVLVHDRNAEHAYDRIADELFYDPAVPLDRVTHRSVVAIEDTSKDFGVETLSELG